MQDAFSTVLRDLVSTRWRMLMQFRKSIMFYAFLHGGKLPDDVQEDTLNVIDELLADIESDPVYKKMIREQEDH